ncbi:MAG: hypothetical protein SFY92_10295 [Verrucomicrobiae bacterium]|nr:hypothetical protein [Verrucomicrobiae bacterium]
MSDENPSSYSPFLPVLIILVCLIVVYAIQTKNIWDQNRQIAGAKKELKNVLPQAENLNGTLVAISQDLLSMARTNNSARAIVEDFKIQAVAPQGK